MKRPVGLALLSGAFCESSGYATTSSSLLSLRFLALAIRPPQATVWLSMPATSLAASVGVMRGSALPMSYGVAQPPNRAAAINIDTIVAARFMDVCSLVRLMVNRATADNAASPMDTTGRARTDRNNKDRGRNRP